MSEGKILCNENGAITVFLSLLFLMMIGLILCVLGGIHDLKEGALAEDAVNGAGEYVTANYDKELFRRYHIFFMDPREKEYIKEDGMSFVNRYLNTSSYFSFACNDLSVSEECYATDWDGKYLKSEIREYMKYQTLKDGAGSLLALANSSKKNNEKSKSLKGTLSHVSNEDKEREKAKEKEEDAEEETEETADELKKKATWKTFKEYISMASASGTLTFATANVGGVSGLSITGDDLPSKGSKNNTSKKIKDPSFSFSNVHSFSKLLKGDLDLSFSTNFLTDEFFVIQYIYDHFYDLTSEEGEEESALKYELEYLIAGKTSDKDNLEYVLNRLLLIRFAANFAYAVSSPSLEAEVSGMALVISGILGLPFAVEAVKYILLASLSYGESMIDVRTLCSGETVPILKSEASWNLRMENIDRCFENDYMAKKGSTNVSYRDYLTVLLIGTVKEKTMYYRMMDLMQENVRLVEADFSMKDCLFSYVWDMNLTCGRMFSFIPVFGLSQDGTYSLNISKMISY